jgi:hypothetical protein
MAYIINKYNGSQLVTVEDGTVDNTTEIKLIGKNFAGYGEQQNENFLFLLENFQGTVAPTKAITGQLWYDATAERLKVYDGTSFKTTAGAEVSQSQPVGFAEGDLWWNSVTNQLYGKNSNNEWNLIGPQATAAQVTEMKTIKLRDSANVERNVIAAFADDYIVEIISEAEFTVNAAQDLGDEWSSSDWTTIKAGHTLRAVDVSGKSNTDSRGNVNYYWGTSSAALKLTDGTNTYGPSDFIQTGSLNFTSLVSFGDAGYTLGDGVDLTVKIGADNETPRIQMHRGELRLSNNADSDRWVITDTAIYPGTSTSTIGTSSNPLVNMYATTFTGTATQADTLEVSGNYRSASTSASNNSIAARDSSGNLTANIFTGTATQARYADLAEKYTTAEELTPGTVVCVGGDAEVEAASVGCIAIGVVSTDPAIMMNSEAEGQYIGLKGRLPVRVTGPVKKGQAVYVHNNGCANTAINGGSLVGVALETNSDEAEKLVECILKV